MFSWTFSRASNGKAVSPVSRLCAWRRKWTNRRHLKPVGIMSYAAMASHQHGWENRRKQSAELMAIPLETVALCRKSGLPVEILSGGCTGTYNFDHENSLTELQAGSYVFMDTVYRKIGGEDNPNVHTDSEPALTVLSTVVSKTRPHQRAIDYGDKADLRPTDEVKDRPGMRVEGGGAEYGMLL